MNFAKRIAVNIVESDYIKQQIKPVIHSDDIKDDKQEKETETKKEIVELAKEYSDYLLRLITTGCANEKISQFDSIDFMNELTLMVLLQSLKRDEIAWTDAWNRNDISDLTKKTTKESQELIMEIYEHFATNEYLENIIDIAKTAANDQLKEWGYDNIQIP